MSDTKFTPGPWITFQPRGDGSVPVRTDGLGITICYVHDGAICDAINNAHLIAAAPELYEVLDRLVNWTCSEHGMIPPVYDAVKALSKARGETPA